MDVHRLSDLTVVIQAGGESKRMGQSKARVRFLGQPLIMRPVLRLLNICDEMIVTTNEPEKLGFLDPYVESGRLRLVSDEMSERGALIGIHTAFSAARTRYAALVACDMLFVSPKLMLALRDRLEGSGADAAVPQTRHGLEPFHAVYRREECLAAVDAKLKCGELRATSWFDDVRMELMDMDEIIGICPRAGVFMNVNTPSELHDVEQWLIENGRTSPLDVPPSNEKR